MCKKITRTLTLISLMCLSCITIASQLNETKESPIKVPLSISIPKPLAPENLGSDFGLKAAEVLSESMEYTAPLLGSGFASEAAEVLGEAMESPAFCSNVGSNFGSGLGEISRKRCFNIRRVCQTMHHHMYSRHRGYCLRDMWRKPSLYLLLSMHSFYPLSHSRKS